MVRQLKRLYDCPINTHVYYSQTGKVGGTVVLNNNSGLIIIEQDTGQLTAYPKEEIVFVEV